jgi:hypothetical protein
MTGAAGCRGERSFARNPSHIRRKKHVGQSPSAVKTTNYRLPKTGISTTESPRAQSKTGRRPLPSIRNHVTASEARQPQSEIELTACRRTREEAVQGAGLGGPVHAQRAAESDASDAVEVLSRSRVWTVARLAFRSRASARLGVRSHVPGTRGDRAQAEEAGIRKAKPRVESAREPQP